MWSARNLASVFRIMSYVLSMGLESVVGTAARYGLEVLGIKSQFWLDFPCRLYPYRRPPSLL